MDRKEKNEIKAEAKKRKEETKERLNTEERDTKKIKEKIFNYTKIIFILAILVGICYVTGTIINKLNYKTQNPVATIEIENYGIVKFEMYPEYAPNTVCNFIALANRGFYDNTTINRVVKDFVVQLGYKSKDNQSTKVKLSDLYDGGPDEEYTIKGEFVLNGFNQNTLKHTKGIVSMARADFSSYGQSYVTKKGYDSASGQFFITTGEDTNMDGIYAAFGKVIEGMDIIEKIENLEVETKDENNQDSNLTLNKPKELPVVTKITVETYGVDYGLPETLEPFDYYSYLMQQQNVGSY